MKSMLDHSSHKDFYDYYAKASQSRETYERFRTIRDTILRIRGRENSKVHPLNIADIGCGAGTQSIIWAELGHQVHSIDVNQPLLELARDRADQKGYKIDFRIGTALALPWTDLSMDICLVPEILEHVTDWKRCLDECIRLIKPGGLLFLTTTNVLCPKQQEFTLPLYSWYPAPVKRYCEHLAMTSHPQIVNFAKYPAVNWFSFYELSYYLTARKFTCMDRFDVMDISKKKHIIRFLNSSIRHVSALRWLAHVTTPYTLVVALKSSKTE